MMMASKEKRDFSRRSLLKGAGAAMAVVAAATGKVDAAERPPRRLTTAPPLGWNSFDSYRGREDEKSMLDNLELFSKKLKPHGYEYFVIDGGWFRQDGSEYLDGYGRYLPAPAKFPNGFKPLVARAHDLGIKFGLWMVRGIPIQAVSKDLTIKGTPYRASSIANKEDVSTWYKGNYGVDTTKPGAQEYYTSLVELLASWEIDFIKWDDIVPHPDEIEAAANAVDACKQPIVLSLSPGDHVKLSDVPAYRRADMVRITGDVWDNRKDLEKAFERWELLQDYGGDGFWLDLDMIPFGDLANRGNASQPFRKDNFTPEQKRSFMAQRALAASPLFMGGNLPTSDEFSIGLVTHPGMLACNQNGVVGKLVRRTPPIEVWKTPNKTRKNQGWLGIFNRSTERASVVLRSLDLGLDKGGSWRFEDVWRGVRLAEGLGSRLDLAPDGSAFLRYELD